MRPLKAAFLAFSSLYLQKGNQQRNETYTKDHPVNILIANWKTLWKESESVN